MQKLQFSLLCCVCKAKSSRAHGMQWRTKFQRIIEIPLTTCTWYHFYINVHHRASWISRGLSPLYAPLFDLYCSSLPIFGRIFQRFWEISPFIFVPKIAKDTELRRDKFSKELIESVKDSSAFRPLDSLINVHAWIFNDKILKASMQYTKKINTDFTLTLRFDFTLTLH